MGLRPQALIEGLDGLPAPGPWHRTRPGCYSAGAGSRRIEIEVSALPDRHLGQLHLPVSAVTLSFHGLDAEARCAFQQAFNRRFQRGGG
ncbi:hypothetical protein ACN2MM_07130 [Alkalilimnicola ehrlichii MLHE-1]|nr:hypothetical protein [Alkalilimnicola ehrlichii]